MRSTSYACLDRTCLFTSTIALGAWLLVASSAAGQVLTQHNDVFRSGANINETKLTPVNVNKNTFGKLFTDSVDGAIVGQSLYLPGVHFPDGSTHNVVYVATQHDSVYAFDADSSQPPLWTVSFINPALGITSVPISAFGCPGTGFTEIGIMSTPVIDSAAGTIYVVAKTEENGAFVFRLHALSVTTGQDVAPPVVLNATASTNKGTLQFNPAIQMQRPALLLLNGVIYIGFGSNGCDSFAYHGWLLAYDEPTPQDELTLQQVGALATTPNGTKGAIWQAGSGPAADTDGTIFLATGNGTFDANTGGADYGDTILHLSAAGSGLNVLDYFTPFNEQTLSAQDLDLGSGGITLLPDQPGSVTHEAIAGGKQGTLYLLNRDSLGGFNSVDDSQIVQSIQGASTGELDQVSAYWNQRVYIGGEDDFVKAFSLSNGVLSASPTSQTVVVFNQAGSGSVSVSANGTRNGILWAMIHGSGSLLYAYDATNLGNLLYGSNQAGLRDSLEAVPHFAVPTVANGKVYIGGKNTLSAYGLFTVLTPAVGNHQSAFVGTQLSLQVKATNPYVNAGIPGISITCKAGGVGVLSTQPVVTDTTGTASFTYTLPKKAQTVAITCSATKSTTAVFSEVAVAGPPSRIVAVSGNFQTGPVATQLPAPLVAVVYDQFSHGVPGVVVTFSDNGAGGTFSNPSVATDSTGHASTLYTTPATPGKYRIQAIVNGITPITFTETAQ